MKRPYSSASPTTRAKAMSVSGVRQPWTRRSVLGGAAAGLVALPWLESRPARAQDSKFPLRLLCVYTPNGTVPENWFPEASSGSSDFALPPILEPFEKYRSRLSVLRGIDSLVGKATDNPGGPHQRGIGSLFTGQKLGDGEFKDGCGKSAGYPLGGSIDQAVAEEIGTVTPLRSLELGVRCYDNDVQGRISYLSSGNPLPPVNDPSLVYSRLFSPPDPIDPSDEKDRSTRILDATYEQFAALRKRVSRHDQEKLDEHLAGLRDLERRLGIGSGEVRCTDTEEPPALDPESETDMPEVSRAHLDLLARAFSCDLVRVATLQYSTGFNRIRYPWLNSLTEGHALSHSGDSDTAAWSEMTSKLTWHAGELAYFMDLLASIPEGEGSVLDRTLIVWGSEVSKGNSHSLESIPYLLLGNLEGRLQAGRYLDFAGRSNCDLLHTIVQAFGVETNSFGHPDFHTGVIEDLLA